MPIPDFQELLRPVLELLSDGSDHDVEGIRNELASQFEVTDEELEELLPSGKTRRYVNTVAWALAHLRRAAAIDSPVGGRYRITDRGSQLLSETMASGEVSLERLKTFPEYSQSSSTTGQEDSGKDLGGWSELIEQGRRSFSDPTFDDRERKPKRKIAAAVSEALSLEDGDEALRALKRAISSGKYSLANFRQFDWLSGIDGDGRAELIATLREFADPDVAPLERFRRFDEVAARYAGKPGRNPGSVLIVGSVLNFAARPEEFPPVKTTPFEYAEQLVGFPQPKGTTDEVYEGHLEFIRLAQTKFEEAGLPIRDTLDVQSIIYEAFGADRARRHNELQAFFERALAEYPAARDHDEFGSDHPLWKAFEEATKTISEVESVADRETLKPRFSIGQGNWARVPWLAILDSGETDSTQHGVYPVFLFRTDGSGLYLTIGQGVTVPKQELGVTAAHEELRSRAEHIRKVCGGLTGRGFKLDGEIDLKADVGLGRDYEASIAAHKFYEAGSVPSDKTLVEDLAAVVDAYSAYLDGSTSAGLEGLVAEWRENTGYPTDDDEARKERRHEVAERLSEDRLRAVDDDAALFEAIEFGKFAHGGYYGSPGPMANVNQALKDSDENKIQMARSLRHLLYGDGPVGRRIDDVIADDEYKVPGFGEALAVKALAVTDPDRWLPIYPYAGTKGKQSVLETPELGAGDLSSIDELSVGERAVRSNDLLREITEPLIPGDPWGQMQFLYWLRDRNIAAKGADESLAPLAERLLLPEPWLDEVADLLREKRQIVFRGPPGTGKTFVARELARHLAGDRSRVRLVQFHASYAYEDFVQGYRPTLVGDSPGFELTDGPLVELAQKAAADREHTYVLIIDELNRGNVAKVFGELYFLLEYRGESVRLQYGSGPSSEDFSLPENLWFIGTMNTADQSIALLDSALRRRFFFVDFYPTEPPVDLLLRRWLKAKGYSSLDWLPDVIDEVNRRLGDREIGLGPSYFLSTEHELTEARVELLWHHAVMPYLEEKFFGDEEQRREYELAALRKAVEEPTDQGSPSDDAELEDQGTPEATD